MRELRVPVSERTVAGWHIARSALGVADVQAQVLVVAGRPVGYGELWLDVVENEVELAHIVVSADARDAGLGGPWFGGSTTSDWNSSRTFEPELGEEAAAGS